MNTKLEVTNLIKPILATLKVASDEIKSLLDIGIIDYLHNQTAKYYFTNTFLHRAEKVRFDKVYFPITTKYNQLYTEFENLENVFDEYKYITLIGSAGSGKSTLVKHIFLSSIRQSYKVPVLIELRHLNGYDGKLLDFIVEKLIDNKVKPSEDTLKRALKKGAFLFLFDGYDEIFSNTKQKISKEIESFVDKYPENKFLISTRPGSGIEGTSRFHSFSVKDLSEKQINEFLDLLVSNKERKNQIKLNINDSNSADYTEYLKNPLLLSMFILAFESHPEIPKRKSAFYKNVFDTLYSKHDGITKGSFPREKKTKLQREDFEELLSALSFLTISEGRYAFTEEYLSEKLRIIKDKKSNLHFNIEDLIFDFRTSISIMMKDGFEYKFPHRSMQEYFTASFLASLPTNKKAKAYKKLNKIFQKSSKDGSLNFWKLCKELDLNSYLEFFVIPELKSTLRLLKKKEGIQLLNAFYKLWNPYFYLITVDFLPELSKEYVKKNKSKELVIFADSNISLKLIDFEKIYNRNIFMDFSNHKNVKTQVINLFLNSKEAILDNFVHDIKIRKLFIDNGINDVINDYVDSIESKITEFETLLEKRDDDLDDLLES